MKHTLCLFLFFASPLMAAMVPYPLSLSPSATSVNVGSVFSVTLSIPAIPTQMGSDLYAFQTELNFDPAVFQVVGEQEGTLLPTGGTTQPFFQIDNAAGSVMFTDSLSGAIIGADTSHGGTLEVIMFEANMGASTSLLSLNPVNVSLQSYDDVNNFSNTFSDNFTGTMASTSVSVNTLIATPEPAAFVSSFSALIVLALMRRRLAAR